LLRQGNRALRFGAQIDRLSSDGPDVYAFSRIDRDPRIEYVVAPNNTEGPPTATVPTYSDAHTKYGLVSQGGGAEKLRTGPGGDLTLTVPPLGFAASKATKPG